MTIHVTDLNNANYSATYCPEDNKLRLYCGRVERSTYDALKAAGFTSTPKQDCDFVAVWTPGREDILLSMIDESDDIGDEDYSPEDRAADRAERFSTYRDKRRAEAGGYADRYDAGPSVVGFQSQARAERAANRIERTRNHALGQWSKAEYWQTRTAGVIGHALHKSSPSTRRGRIVKLESEQRKHLASIEEAQKRFAAWQKVLTLDGADVLVGVNDQGYFDKTNYTPAGWLAYKLANDGRYTRELSHPDAETREAIAAKTTYKPSAYDLLVSDVYWQVPIRRLTPAELARLIIGGRTEAVSPDSYRMRWARHFELRLNYERQMLANEGGSVTDVEIVPGGWFGKYQVAKVHKSNASKKVVSVSMYNSEGKLVRANVQRLGEAAYRPPTEQELAEFHAAEKARKQVAKATTPAKPQLINPTDADAERLQEILNAKRGKGFTADDEGQVQRMNQATYSANSKGAYARCVAVDITEQLEKYNPSYYGGNNQVGQKVMFKVRMHGSRVIVLTDKPQKPLPWKACDDQVATHPTFMEMVHKLEWFAEQRGTVRHKEDMPADMAEVFHEMQYHGLGFTSTWTDWGLSKEGHKWLATIRMLKGDLNYGYQCGLTGRDGKPTAEAIKFAAELGQTFDGATCAAAQ